MYGFEPYLRYRCKMHDLLHDLAIQVAGTESKFILKEDLVESSAALRHISTSCQANFLLDSSGMSSHSKTLRTLLFRDRSAEMNTESLDSYLASFRMLRVLQLSGLNLNKVPDSIGEMIHLRYIDLSRNSLKVLPNSICELHHLQTLDLRNCSSMEELPSDIGKLVSLRHLFLYGCDRLDPSGLAVLTTLVTLDKLNMDHCKGRLEYLGGLDDLSGTLEIEFPAKEWANWIEDARKSNMSRKHKLNGMIVNFSKLQHQADEEENRTKELLEELKPSQNIQHLQILTHNADILSSWFSSLSNLRTLELISCSIEYLDVSCTGSGSSLFPCLKELRMSYLSNLKGWWRELGNNVPIPVLPRVSRVEVRKCPNLTESMPVLGEEIKELRLSGIKGELVSKLVSTPNTSCTSSIYTKMESLYLDDILDIKCFPTGWLSQLTGLKSLTMHGCGELSWVYSCGLAHLTSLEKLRLYNSWGTRVAEIDNGLEIMQWQGLKRLRVLHMPWQSHLQEGLQYLTSLEELGIVYNEANQVETDNEDMEGRGLAQKLGVMERLHLLHIEFSGRTCSFPKWIQYLRCLKTLILKEGSILSLSMGWGILANMSLEVLRMIRIRNVFDTSLDDRRALQQTQFHSLVVINIYTHFSQEEGSYFPWNFLSSLRILELFNIRDLFRIPDGIQHLTSLQELMLSSCGRIDEIPKCMINLTSLQRLHFSRSASHALQERCRPQVGEDWHLISHIPDFMIDGIRESD